MNLEHAIKTLQKELDLLNTPSEEEDDLIDVIIYSRNSHDIKFALKILNEFLENNKILRL